MPCAQESEVAAGARDLLDEEAPDLVRERGKLVRAQRLEVVGSPDALEQTHRCLPPGLLTAHEPPESRRWAPNDPHGSGCTLPLRNVDAARHSQPRDDL